jgi:hypothetical protein
MSERDRSTSNFSWKCRNCPTLERCSKNKYKVCPDKASSMLKSFEPGRERGSRYSERARSRKRYSGGGVSGKVITYGLIGSLAFAALISKVSEIKAGNIYDAGHGILPAVPTQPAGGVIYQDPNLSTAPAPERALPDIFNIFGQEANTGGSIAPFFHEVPVGQWETKIIQYASQFPNINPNMVATTVAIESCGNPNAVSGGGALGLGQLMQSTFPEYTKQQLLDPDTNLFLTAQYISQLMTSSGGNFQAALAGYNGGPEALKWISGQSSRDGYIYFLMNHKSGIWRAYEKANAKANEVERMVELSYMYNDAMSGSRATFDAMQASGRCVR